MSQRKRKRKPHPNYVNWMRESKRLKRLSEPAEVIDEDIMMYDVINVTTVIQERACIDHQPLPNIPSATTMSLSPSQSDKSLCSLPAEILYYLIDYLDVPDVLSLSEVNSTLKMLVDTEYYGHLMLPCKAGLLNTLTTPPRLKVLRLTTNRCFRLLLNPKTGRLPFNELNLTHLKELSLSGANYKQGVSHSFDYILKDEYISTLLEILQVVSADTLTRLEFNTENTTRMVTHVAPALRKFRRLQRLTLHGRSSDAPRATQPHTGGQLLTVLANNTYATQLELKKYLLKESNVLTLSCHWIRVLRVDLGKTGNMNLVDMRCLEELVLLSADFMTGCYCPRHHSHGSLVRNLAEASPNLRYCNYVDLKRLEMMSGTGKDWKPWWVIVESMGSRFCKLDRELRYRREYGADYIDTLFPEYD
eukprot:TRINITY_DN4247_c0_g1_i2.p1 TRINITY_DN4247_c0_g1~~TRINITY_DN4247_c0_g1_i2.p1  ORF type:complete len:418 (+),score=84.70 TRINITY_DN4247_c0_g1_i2:35-1288(+)